LYPGVAGALAGYAFVERAADRAQRPLAARARLLNTGHARKTDSVDATSVAMVAMRHQRPRPVRAEDDEIVPRLLSQRRDDLAEERTRAANRPHALLRDLIAGGRQAQPDR
jgi:transposase